MPIYIERNLFFQNFTGTVDLGNGQNDDEDKAATHSLVFMVNGINSRFKLPIAHFFITSLTGSELANLVSDAIHRLNEVGVIITNITCDNPVNNWRMLEILGSNLSWSSLKVSLAEKNILGVPILATPDVVHLLKLVRNTLGDFKVLKDGNGNSISWNYLVELQKLQESEGYHLANRLRLKHIDWRKNKMSTPIAAQTLSESVADAIDYCREHLKLPAFMNSEATTKFLRTFNSLFDVLNSKSKFGKRMKAPIDSKNFAEICDFFETAKIYICDLKHVSGKRLVDGPRKKAFVGFLANMESFKHMYKAYVQTGHLNYILTYKCSQDHLGLILSDLFLIIFNTFYT